MASENGSSVHNHGIQVINTIRPQALVHITEGRKSILGQKNSIEERQGGYSAMLNCSGYSNGSLFLLWVSSS
jgi:hypothetical protein